MNYSINDLGPYNPLFREAPGLILDTIDKAIFRFVWDEYVGRIRGGKMPLFQLKLRDVERKTGIDRHTVAIHLENLVWMKLILKDGENYSVNGDYFLSLLKLGHSLTKPEDKKSLRLAISTANKEKLNDLGFEYLEGISSLLTQMSGRVTSYPDGEDSTQVGNILPSWGQSYPSGNNITQLGAIRSSWIDKIRAYVCENYKMEDIIAVFEEENGYDSTQLGIITPTYEIFSKSKSLSDEAIAVLEIFAGSLLMDFGYNSTQQVGKILPRGGYDFTHSKKKEKENNKNNEPMLPASDNKGVKESDDLNEEVVDEIPSEEIKRMDMGNYSQKKLKSQLPFYTSQEIQEILNNPQEAVTSNDKLFIRVLWNVAKEQASVDQDDQEVEVDVEGYKFPADRFQRDILSPALEETNEIIEAGMLRTEVENLPIELEELQPEQVELILDWETGRDSVGPFIVGSASRFHKIYSEPVEEPRRRRGRNSRNTEEREKAKEYFRNLLRCDDDGYDRLSQIEKAVFNFANEFLEVDWASGEVTGLADSEDLKEKFISPDHYTGFLAMLREDIGLNITREDFESVLNQAEPQPTGALDHIGETMFSIFSYEKIQAWIKKHNG